MNAMDLANLIGIVRIAVGLTVILLLACHRTRRTEHSTVPTRKGDRHERV